MSYNSIICVENFHQTILFDLVAGNVQLNSEFFIALKLILFAVYEKCVEVTNIK